MNAQELELWHASNAVAVTVLEPTGNKEPAGGDRETVTGPGKVSLAVGAGSVLTRAPPESRGSSATLTLGGQLMVGGSVSLTSTAVEQAVEQPLLVTTSDTIKLLEQRLPARTATFG